MQHGELRRIKKATRALVVEGHEVSPFSVAIGKRPIFMGCAESAVEGIETAGRLSLIEAGAGCGVNHQASLVAVLGGRGASDDFQRLDRIYRNLGREHLA